jgi:O-antigen/teichoic acid export membrane protein
MAGPTRFRELRSDKVVHGSFFLMASTGTTAALGFVFWVVVARLYTPAEVGMATSLISAISLIAYFSLFGLNSTIIRFPAWDARNAQITQSIVLVIAAAGVIGFLYLVGLPWYGPKLAFIRDSLVLSVAFVVICAFAGLNLLTDAVFIGERMPQYNVVADGLIQGFTKLVLCVVLVGFGASSIVGAAGGGYITAVLVSVLLMRRRMSFRFDIRARRTRLLEQFGFSAASYASSILNLAPIMAIPMIVLQQLGAQAAGYYYIAFQISNLLNAVSYAVGESVFAEVSNNESRFNELLKRSAILLATALVPAVIVVVAASEPLLRVFGGLYATGARQLLVVLSVGAVAVGLNTWANFALKLARRMVHLIFSNVMFAATTIGLAVVWAPRGLVWLGWAWCVGNLLSGLYAATALFARRSAAGWVTELCELPVRTPARQEGVR